MEAPAGYELSDVATDDLVPRFETGSGFKEEKKLDRVVS